MSGIERKRVLFGACLAVCFIAAFAIGVAANCSSGRKVPHLVGLSLEEARAVAEKGGFRLEIKGRESDPRPEGTVLSQNPEPGMPAEGEAAISVVISGGQRSETVKLPDFVSSCLVKIGQYSKLLPGNKNFNAAKITEFGDIIGFDSKKQNTHNYNCKTEIEKYFKKFPVKVCIPGVDCNPFIISNPKPPANIQALLNNCDINPVRVGNTVAITRQGVACAELNNYFINAYTCSDTATPRFV